MYDSEYRFYDNLIRIILGENGAVVIGFIVLLVAILLCLCKCCYMLKPHKYEKISMTKRDMNGLEKYGYPTFDDKSIFIPQVETDNELTTFIKNMISVFDYDVNIENEDYMIRDPIIISDDRGNSFELWRVENEKCCSWKLVVNDEHVYKFSHISNVQLYFEMINEKFLLK